MPPQVRPISHASASLSSSRSSDDRPSVRTRSLSSTTRASTHPPIVTAPRIRPRSPTHILAPAFRGVVPCVPTSVAITTRPSVARSASSWAKVSRKASRAGVIGADA